MYIYEGHLGNLYVSNNKLNFNDLYCETCGDWDRLIGKAQTKEEAFNLFQKDEWNMEYIKDFINKYFK